LHAQTSAIKGRLLGAEFGNSVSDSVQKLLGSVAKPGSVQSYIAADGISSVEQSLRLANLSTDATSNCKNEGAQRKMTMADTIVLNVHIEAKDGRQEDLARELQALVAPTRRETGCLAYELHRDPEDEKMFMFYEQFADQVALDAHIDAPYFKKFLNYRGQDDPVLRQTVTRWSKLA
jgi:quinol monooxygenase YgiN